MTDDEQVCIDDYPEHDYVLFDEADGIRVLHCRRCDAEAVEEDETPELTGQDRRV